MSLSPILTNKSYDIAATIKVAAGQTVTHSGSPQIGIKPILRNTQRSRHYVPAFDVSGTLRLRDLILEGQAWQIGGKWGCNQSVRINGGLAEMYNVTGKDGYTVQVTRGRLIWRGGGGSGYSYGLYLGDSHLDPAAVVERGELDSLTFDGTRKEANLRSQGCKKLIAKSCKFRNTVDAARPKDEQHGKESVALRLIDAAVFTNCEFDNIEVGPRAPDVTGDDIRVNKTRPNYVAFIDCNFRGYLRVGGNSHVIVQGGQTTARDARGVDGPAAFSTVAYGMKPTLMLKDHPVCAGYLPCTPDVIVPGDKEWKQDKWMEIWAKSNAG